MTIPKPRFDGTVNLGHALTILSFFVAAFMAYNAVLRAIDNHETRLIQIETDRGRLVPIFEQMTKEVVAQDARLKVLEQVQRSNADTNAKLLDQIGGLREDMAAVKAQLGVRSRT